MNRTVRYFGRQVDPAPYERGFGVSSVIIRVANWLRMHLERIVVERVYRLELAGAGHSKKEQEEAVQASRDAPWANPFSAQDDARGQLRTLFKELPDGYVPLRAERYRRDAEPNPLIPVEESGLFKRALANELRHRDRSVRYQQARGTKILIPEELFMPVEKTEESLNIPSPAPTSGDTVDDALKRLRLREAEANLRRADFNLGRSERYLTVPDGLAKTPRR